RVRVMSTWADIDLYLSNLGIRIGTPTIGQTVGGVHAPGSYHYAGRARDYGQSTSDMRAIWDALLPHARSGVLIELFGPWGAWKAGRDIEYIGGHTDHVHAAIAADGVLGASQVNQQPERKPCLTHIPYPPGFIRSYRLQPDRATGSSSKTEPSTHSETPRISAVSSYQQTLSSNDHDHPEHGWMYDPNGWELV
ncbi:MAG TPA: hypothetical protein VJQ57_00015, partial [Acidimicrobiia bacterium]|nr:hypothetical protein [Acidimicrobiia bacterium]